MSCMFNKTSKRVDITCMEEVIVLQKYGIEVMGHRDLISYGKLIQTNYIYIDCWLFCLNISIMF